MANDKMDDNKRGLSPEEMDAIFEKYENGEISEAELADAISNASTDTNFTDDFSDKFFTDHVNIDPNTIQEESIEQAVRGTVDDDVNDPFNGTRDINESKSFAGSGKAPSKKQDIEEKEGDQGQDSTPRKRTAKKSVKKRPGKKAAGAAGAAVTGSKKASAHPSTNPFNQEVADSRRSSSDYSSPFDDEDTEVDEELREEVDDEFEADLEEELEQEELEQEGVEHEDLLEEGRAIDGDGKPSHSPFDSPVTLNDDEKSSITPGAKGSSVPDPFNEKNSKGGKTSQSGSDKNSSTRYPFGDPSGLGSNARDANISKKKAPNIWAQRFAALTAASQPGENSDQENNQNMKGQAPDNNQEVPQNKKKKSKAPAIIALLLTAVLLLPMSMMMSGTMVSNQVVGAGGTCSDGVSMSDVDKRGARGVPEGETSNPEIMPPGRLTSPFGPRGGADHRGQDIATGGSEVGLYAYYDGVVSVLKDNPGGFGYYIVIDHQNKDGDPFTSLYGHVFPKDVFVEVGDTVKAGQLLAYEGYNGGVDPPGPGGQHLHFEIAPNVSGGAHFYNQVDPAPYLKDSLNPSPNGVGGVGGGSKSTSEKTTTENADNASREINFGLPKAHAQDTMILADETTSSSPTTSEEDGEDDATLPATFFIGDNTAINTQGKFDEMFEGNIAMNIINKEADFDKILEEINNKKDAISDPEYKYVILSAGTYGGVTPEKYEEAVNKIKEINPNVKVVGVTVALADEHEEKYNSVKDHMQETNRTIKEKSDIYADWSAASKKGDYLEKNGVKVSHEGAQAYVDTIVDAILKGAAKEKTLGSNGNICCGGGSEKKNKNGTYNPNNEEGSSDINEEMEKNADTIAAVLDELGMGDDEAAHRIAYLGALGESSLTNKANDGKRAVNMGSNQPDITPEEVAETLNYPHVGEDSPLAVTGVYQQTLKWWGSAEDLMQPAYQAAQYITEMKKKNPNYKTDNFFKVITVTQVQEIWDPNKAPEAHDTYQVYNQHQATADKLINKYMGNHRELTSEEKALVEKGKKNREGNGGGGESSSSSSGSDKNKNNANAKCKASGSKQSGDLPKDAKERVEKVIEEGRRMRAKNIPYSYGSNDPESGMDCSAFISYIWNKAAGIKIGRSTDAIKMNMDKVGGLEVDREDVQPGDLMLWSGHVAMVTEKNTRMEAGNPVGSENPMSEENIGQQFIGYYRVSSLPEEMEKKGITYDDLEVSNIAG